MKKIVSALLMLGLAGTVLAGSMEMTSARLYKKQGEWAKALQFYDTELEKNPTNGEAYLERGEMLGEIAMDPARSGLAKQIAGDSGLPQRVLLERTLSDFAKARANGDEKSVKKWNKSMDKTINEAWNSLYVSAVHLDSVEQFDKSLQQADLAILLKPDDWRAYGLKGQVLDRKISKLADEAGQSSRPAAERDSLQHLAGQSTKAALQAWADAHEHLGRSDWAKDKPEDYKQAMQIIRGRLLEGYYNAHDYPKTIHFADEVLKDDKQNTDAIQFKAFAFAQMASDTAYSASQRDSLKRIAVEALNAARAERKDYPPIIYTIGQFNLQLGDTTAALSAFDDYLKLEPEDRDARFIMGVIYLEGGSFVNPEKARDTFKALTEHHPEDSAAWINYGVALIRLGQQEEGKKAIEEGKRLAGE